VIWERCGRNTAQSHSRYYPDMPEEAERNKDKPQLEIVCLLAEIQT